MEATMTDSTLRLSGIISAMAMLGSATLCAQGGWEPGFEPRWNHELRTAAGPDGVCGTLDDNRDLFGADGVCGGGDDQIQTRNRFQTYALFRRQNGALATADVSITSTFTPPCKFVWVVENTSPDLGPPYERGDIARIDFPRAEVRALAPIRPGERKTATYERTRPCVPRLSPIGVTFNPDSGPTPDLVPAEDCHLLLGTAGTEFQLGNGDCLLVVPLVTFFVTRQDIPDFAIPNDPALFGARLCAQVYMNNPGDFPTDPVQLSNGLEVTLGIGVDSYGEGGSKMLLWVAEPPLLGARLRFRFSIPGV